ncbi:metal-dependent transcriptional regulator [Psychroflexus planctonicus]|uniref:Transcriptional regulator MntR n=1 Tax=Psychroflexus planctonicus TaxID=1526575 RepID=A0ABQ1SDV2_9FLAO|nr:metal-dependent transcriptional regulator [Psychroflexus planctonicus]GGE24646.1 iron-dependent repressor [Psychroflexus planctonicus]
MFSLSEENYLKAIFHLEKKINAEVSTNALAEEMNSKASSVTDMLKKMADKDLVIYKKYQGVKLSELGRKTAVEIIRKHRLWEVFLVEKLNFSWDEVHDVAEELEHIKSKKLITELDNFLGNPKRDPHGDPIPDASGNFLVVNKAILKNLNVSEKGIFVGVKDSSVEFLQYLDKNEIALGKSIKVIEKEAFDGSMRIQIENDQTVNISEQVSENLYIKSI